MVESEAVDCFALSSSDFRLPTSDFRLCTASADSSAPGSPSCPLRYGPVTRARLLGDLRRRAAGDDLAAESPAPGPKSSS